MVSHRWFRNVAILKALVVAAGSFAWISVAPAQGPTSRGTLPGATTQRQVPNGYGSYSTVTETEEIPVPDMFRTEAPLVERNIRFDYLYSHHLHEPLANESQFFTEVSYSFTERFGILFSAPYLIQDHFDGSQEDGFGDIAAGARYVVLGSEQEQPFKLALGFNVFAPTGAVARELGEGQTYLEPELLTQFILTDQTFSQLQLSLGVPTADGGTTEFEYNTGVGYVFKNSPKTTLFSYPTLIAEVLGATGIGGAEAGTSILDVAGGLRWTVGEKMFAGFGVSVPVTNQREFETQYIFSLIYRYGVDPGTPVSSGVGAPSSRAYF